MMSKGRTGGCCVWAGAKKGNKYCGAEAEEEEIYC